MHPPLPSPSWTSFLICSYYNLIALIIVLYIFREEINRAYKKLAVLLHPDKSVAPGTEEAFKALVGARAALLQNHR